MPTYAIAISFSVLLMGCKSSKNGPADKLAEPAPSQSVPIDGVVINYTESFEGRHTPTLVLIHGFGASLETWHDVYPLLAKGYDVVRLDLKGAGFSSKPDDGRYAPEDQARILLKFLQKRQLTNVVLVGHSLGGGVALTTYFLCGDQTPETNMIKGLVLIDSAGYPQKLPFFVSIMRNPLKRWTSCLMSPEYRARFVLERIFWVKTQITPQRIHRYAFFLDQPGSRRALTETANSIVPKNVSELNSRFQSISVPTLIIWGDHDPVIPLTNAERFTTDIPDSKAVVLPFTGHVPHEERPEDVLDAIDQFIGGMK
jgi:pimeloyl-ACP methyl ester carboxylesterase